MPDLTANLVSALLGFGTGIFAVLSLLEKPVWRLMTQPRSPNVADEEARAVHAILKRVIHLLPPTMITTLAAVSLLIAAQLYLSGFAPATAAVAGVFFAQLVLILVRLRKDIRGVDEVPSGGEIGIVRDGLGALALLHHRGLLMTATTLIAHWFAHVP